MPIKIAALIQMSINPSQCRIKQNWSGIDNNFGWSGIDRHLYMDSFKNLEPWSYGKKWSPTVAENEVPWLLGTDQGPWQILTRYICRAVSHGLMYTLIWYDVCETNIFRLFINIAGHHMDLRYRPVTLTLLVVRFRTLLILFILIPDILKFCMYSAHQK